MSLRLGLNLGLTSNLNSILVTEFDFTVSMPDGFTVTRSGTSATERDSNGDWVQSTANTGRIQHDSAGNALGVLIENQVTNKANHANFAPTTIGNIAVTSGDGSASVVTDASISSATIDGSTFTDFQNGDVIALTGGTGGTTYQVSVTAGNTNNHSYRIMTAPQGTGYHGNVKLNNGVAINNYGTSSGNWEEIVAENFAVDNAARFLSVFVTASKTVHISGVQFEEGSLATSPIITTGTTGTTRNRDEVVNNNISAYINSSAGAAVVEAYTFGSQDGFFGLTDDDTASEVVGIQTVSGDGFIEGQLLSSSSDSLSDKVGKPLTDDIYATGMVWNSEEAKIIHSHGATTYFDTSVIAPADTLNQLWIGRWKRYFGYSDKLIVNKISLFKGNATLKDAIGAFSSNVGALVGWGGQSNIAYAQKNQTVSNYNNAGEVEAVSQLNNFYSTARNGITNMAIGGARLYKGAASDNNYWLENDESSGYLLNRLTEVMNANGANKYVGFQWNQGESNGSDTYQELIDGWQVVFNKIWSIAPNLPIIFEPPARRSDNASGDSFYETWLDAIEYLVDNNADLYMGANTKVLALYDETGVSDAVHLSDASYAEKAKWGIRKIASLDGQSVTGAVDYSTISSAVRSGTTVTVTLSHPSGITDFTPITAIEGFVFEDDGTPITINSAVRTDPTTITLTLDSSPSGVEVLKYCYGTGYGLDPAQLVRGNDSNNMPLQAVKITL